MTEEKITHTRKLRNDLSAEYLRSIIEYDPESGEFSWKRRPGYPAKWNTRYSGKIAGTVCTYHNRILIRIDGKQYQAHRLAWLYMTGEWPQDDIDHKDCNRLNNKFNNLRSCTHTQNCANTKGRSGRCGLKGVDYHKRMKKYRARIRMGGTQVFLGNFDTPDDAHEAYCKAVYKFHGEFARTG